MVTAIYPAVWGIGQIITGKMSDKICKKDMLFWGMILQAIALILFAVAVTITQFVLLAILLGCGTAMVYPTFLASIAENTHPQDRPKSLGVFRFWRDLGYAIGAIITGIIADTLGINSSIIFIAVVTFISGWIIYYRMKCNDNNFVRIKYWIINKVSKPKKIPDYKTMLIL
jgi:MFS family permease